MDQRVRVLIVDTHRLFGQCLASALAQEDELEVLEIADGSDEALTRIKEEIPDVLLVNSNLRDDSALELTREVGRGFPGLKAIMYGMSESDDGYVEHIEAGLRGYLFERGSSLPDLKRVIRQVVVDEISCPPEVNYAMFIRLSELASENWWINRAKTMKLTPREVEILELIAEGLPNREIGERLFLSLHTIKNHVHKILRKLEVSGRAEAVEYAYKNDWLKSRLRT
jgi:DNA-binding NarL/FixJ family response regulator